MSRRLASGYVRLDEYTIDSARRRLRQVGTSVVEGCQRKTPQQLLAPQQDQGSKYSYQRQPGMDVLASKGGLATVPSIEADDVSLSMLPSSVARKSGVEEGTGALAGDLVNGLSLLRESVHFSQLQCCGTLTKVFEEGQHTRRNQKNDSISFILMQALAQLPADLLEMLTPVRKLVVRKTG
uniref:Uncharacterized protein n=1 Tax=Peronospora matthiolae TaxID=2874970 RepID=A0AAV1UE89_9STRA